MKTDTEIVNWLEAHPLPAEISGGRDDGLVARFWGISALSGTLREAVSRMIETGSERQKVVDSH